MLGVNGSHGSWGEASPSIFQVSPHDLELFGLALFFFTFIFSKTY